jgi:hypothetical protein
MKEYAVTVELVYFHDLFVKANSESEAVASVMDNQPFNDNFKVIAFGKEKQFDSIEYVSADEVNNV